MSSGQRKVTDIPPSFSQLKGLASPPTGSLRQPMPFQYSHTMSEINILGTVTIFSFLSMMNLLN